MAPLADVMPLPVGRLDRVRRISLALTRPSGGSTRLVIASEFTDDVDRRGIIGLQVQGIRKSEGPDPVHRRNICIQELAPGDVAPVAITGE